MRALLLAPLALAASLAAQVSARPAPAVAAQTPPAVEALTPVVQPATTQLAQMLPLLRPEKWKLSADLRRQTTDNLSSISTDLNSTLPPLLSAADSTPAALPSLLALSRNLRALYDVTLRVLATSEVAAPEQQAEGLANALSALNTAIHHLDGSIDTAAQLQMGRIATLQTSLTKANTDLATANSALQAQTKPKPTAHSKSKVHHRSSSTTSTAPTQ